MFINPRTLNFYDIIFKRNLNDIDYLNYYNHLLKIYVNRFKWEGFNFKGNYIEQALLSQDLICFNHNLYGLVIQPCVITGYNLYQEPSQYKVISTDKELNNIQLNDSNSVLFSLGIFNTNNYRMLLVRYAEMIANVNRTIEVYSNGMKKPIVITGSNNNKKTMQALANNINNNEKYILLDSALESGNVNFFENSNNANDLLGIQCYKKNILNEFFNMIGICSMQMDKGSQLTTSEVKHNNAVAENILLTDYNIRKEFCDRVEKTLNKKIICYNNVREINENYLNEQVDNVE